MKTFHEHQQLCSGDMLGLLLVPSMQARPIVITAEGKPNRMAVLSSLAPRLSWAMDARAGIGVSDGRPDALTGPATSLYSCISLSRT